MLTVSCVLKSGGAYDATWVAKLRRGVARHLSVPHRFLCFSDVPVACERLPLLYGWAGWWSKLEVFDGRVLGKHLYLDLDTIVTGAIDALAQIEAPFAMLRNFGRRHYVGSGVMWFRHRAPAGVFERFAADPERLMERYRMDTAKGAHFGDQAFIFDAVGDANIVRIQDAVPPGMISCYPKNFAAELPRGCSLVCFKGKVKPPDALMHAWAQGAWA